MMKRKIISNKNAVSTTISTVLVVAIVISGVAIVMGWGIPYIEEQKIKSQKQTAENGFLALAESTNDLILKGMQTAAISDISNENEVGSITLNSKSDRFVLWYSFNDAYNFTVSGLENEGSSFIITEIDKPLSDGGLDRVDLYKINAGLNPDRFDIDDSNSDNVWYKKIYDNITDGDADCAQRFSPQQGGHITGVRVYIAKSGYINSNLDVCIFEEDNNNFIIPPKAKYTISNTKIYTYQQIYNDPNLGWIDCNFDTPVELKSNEYYYILVTTDGEGGNESNFYFWYLNNNIYGNTNGENGNSTDEYALTGSFNDGLSAWTKLQGRDFPRRILYSENSPPETPYLKIDGEIISDDYEFFSGVEYTFKIGALDSDNDKISYSISWGDGNYSDWSGFDSDEIIKSHIWSKVGVYSIIVNAKDDYGNICNITKKYTINVKPFQTIPLDAYDVLLNLTEDNGDLLVGSGDVVVDISNRHPGKNLDGDLFINLIDHDNVICPDPLDPTKELYNGTDGRVPFGRIWAFDIGALTSTASYESDTIKTIYQNGAIFSVSSSGVEFIKEPTFFEKTNANQNINPNEKNALAMRFVQINGSVSAGGSSFTSTVGYTITNSLSREPYFVDNFYNLKMQIFGENQDIWYNYFNEKTNFVLSTDNNGNKILIYNQEVDDSHVGKEDFSLVLDNTFIDFWLVRLQ